MPVAINIGICCATPRQQIHATEKMTASTTSPASDRSDLLVDALLLELAEMRSLLPGP